MIENVLTVGAMSMLVLEGLKMLIRWYKKDTAFVFVPAFYVVMLPVLNVALQPVGAWLGLEGVIMPTDWMQFLKTILVVALGSLASVGEYTITLRQWKEYTKKQAQLQ